MVGILTETSTAQQLTKMYVKHSHLVVISNWQHSRYCGKILHNTDIESLIYSIYEISVVVSLSVVVPKEDEQEC